MYVPIDPTPHHSKKLIRTDFTTPVFAWTMIESSLAVVGANLPLLRPLLHRKTYTSSYAWSLFRSLRIKNSENGSQERVGSKRGGSFEGSFKANTQVTEKPKSGHEFITKPDALHVGEGRRSDGGFSV